jgi:hypothetical protein
MTEPIITVETPHDSLTFTGTDVAGGWIYDNETLRTWLRLTDIESKLSKRPNAHGTYDPEQVFAGAGGFTLIGKYFGTSIADATDARDRLLGLFSDGYPSRVTVEDAKGATSRTAFVVEVDPEWNPDGHFEFQVEFVAPDPRRYGNAREVTTGLASPSSGLVWPLGSGASYWDWGTVGNDGRMTFTNDGNTTTYPIIEVGDGGSFDAGFVLTEVETGRELAYSVATLGQVVTLDNRTQRARINGSDVTGGLTRRQWFEVPSRSSRTYQLATLGATTGTPTARLIGADAYL